MGKFGAKGKDLATTNFYNNLGFKALGLEWLTGYVREDLHIMQVLQSCLIYQEVYIVSNGGKNINKQANKIIADLNLYGVNVNQALNMRNLII